MCKAQPIRASMSGRQWVDRLTEEDLAFLKRFLLASGTLKDVASQYGISYPTVRLRLDRLIPKVVLLDETESRGRVETALRLLYAEGRLDDSTFAELLRVAKEEEVAPHDHTASVA